MRVEGFRNKNRILSSSICCCGAKSGCLFILLFKFSSPKAQQTESLSLSISDVIFMFVWVLFGLSMLIRKIEKEISKYSFNSKSFE